MSLVHAFCQLSAHFKLSTPGFVQGCKVDVSWRTEQLLESCLLLWRLESRSIAPKRPGRQPPDCFSELQNTKSQLKSIANRFPALRNMSRFGVCLPVQSPLSLCARPVLMSRGLSAPIRRGGGSAVSNVCMGEQVVLWEWKPPPIPKQKG